MKYRVEQLGGELRTLLMGASLRDRVRIATMLAHAHARFGRGAALLRWLPSWRDPPQELVLRSGRQLLARRADGVVLYEHVGLDVYGRDLGLNDVRTIVDLGANIGLSTLALAGHYPEARFVCVEPLEENVQLLTHNLERNGVDATVLRVAVVGEAGRFEIDNALHPAASHTYPAADGHVRGMTLESILDQAGVVDVDLLKIDIEGAERGVFEHADGWARRVRAIIGELHNGLSSDEVERRLSPYGFATVSLPDTERFRGLVCFTKADSSVASGA